MGNRNFASREIKQRRESEEVGRIAAQEGGYMRRGSLFLLSAHAQESTIEQRIGREERR